MLIVFVDVVKVSRVQPGSGKEVIVTFSRELLLKTPEMNPERVFSCYVVHAQKMVYSLPWQQRAQPLGRETPMIEPIDIPLGLLSLLFSSSVLHLG